MEVIFEASSLEKPELFDPAYSIDGQKLCGFGVFKDAYSKWHSCASSYFHAFSKYTHCTFLGTGLGVTCL
jgi:hypothetical protein